MAKVTLAIAMAPTCNAKVEGPPSNCSYSPLASSKYSLVSNQLGSRWETRYAGYPRCLRCHIASGVGPSAPEIHSIGKTPPMHRLRREWQTLPLGFTDPLPTHRLRQKWQTLPLGFTDPPPTHRLRQKWQTLPLGFTDPPPTHRLGKLYRSATHAPTAATNFPCATHA